MMITDSKYHHNAAVGVIVKKAPWVKCIIRQIHRRVSQSHLLDALVLAIMTMANKLQSNNLNILRNTHRVWDYNHTPDENLTVIVHGVCKIMQKLQENLAISRKTTITEACRGSSTTSCADELVTIVSHNLRVHFQ